MGNSITVKKEEKKKPIPVDIIDSDKKKLETLSNGRILSTEVECKVPSPYKLEIPPGRVKEDLVKKMKELELETKNINILEVKRTEEPKVSPKTMQYTYTFSAMLERDEKGEVESITKRLVVVGNKTDNELVTTDLSDITKRINSLKEVKESEEVKKINSSLKEIGERQVKQKEILTKEFFEKTNGLYPLFEAMKAAKELGYSDLYEYNLDKASELLKNLDKYPKKEIAKEESYKASESKFNEARKLPMAKETKPLSELVFNLSGWSSITTDMGKKNELLHPAYKVKFMKTSEEFFVENGRVYPVSEIEKPAGSRSIAPETIAKAVIERTMKDYAGDTKALQQFGLVKSEKPKEAGAKVEAKTEIKTAEIRTEKKAEEVKGIFEFLAEKKKNDLEKLRKTYAERKNSYELYKQGKMAINDMKGKPVPLTKIEAELKGMEEEIRQLENDITKLGKTGTAEKGKTAKVEEHKLTTEEQALLWDAKAKGFDQRGMKDLANKARETAKVLRAQTKKETVAVKVSDVLSKKESEFRSIGSKYSKANEIAERLKKLDSGDREYAMKVIEKNENEWKKEGWNGIYNDLYLESISTALDVNKIPKVTQK